MPSNRIRPWWSDSTETASGISGAIQLRDWSGNWDDDYDGQVFFAVIGE
jgi:hypothetical protein